MSSKPLACSNWQINGADLQKRPFKPRFPVIPSVARSSLLPLKFKADHSPSLVLTKVSYIREIYLRDTKVVQSLIIMYLRQTFGTLK